MNQVLSDEEIEEIQNREFSQNDWLWFYARAIEQAILNKLSVVGYYDTATEIIVNGTTHPELYLPVYLLKESK